MDTNIKENTLKQIKNLSPKEYLTHIVGFEIPDEIKKELAYFQVEYGLKPEVINVIISYSYHISKTNFVFVKLLVNYEGWKKEKVETAEDAMELLRKEHKAFQCLLN
ncbi:DnaD domain protein [Priestia filamentosa]|uniref:DnaD domain protein n=1 Tax=Priestia filamentosa TaxID=1402861 RepID=UPI00397B63E3